jgi:hypothetical protein
VLPAKTETPLEPAGRQFQRPGDVLLEKPIPFLAARQGSDRTLNRALNEPVWHFLLRSSYFQFGLSVVF